MLTLFKPFHFFDSWECSGMFAVWTWGPGHVGFIASGLVYIRKPSGVSKRVYKTNVYMIEMKKTDKPVRFPSEPASSFECWAFCQWIRQHPRWKSLKNGSQQLMVGRLQPITTQWISSMTLGAMYSLHARAHMPILQSALSPIPLQQVLCVVASPKI